ncbi:hypothetical protein ACIRPT_27435 [Streptomyces sp. NPDC101227]
MSRSEQRAVVERFLFALRTGRLQLSVVRNPQMLTQLDQPTELAT